MILLFFKKILNCKKTFSKSKSNR